MKRVIITVVGSIIELEYVQSVFIVNGILIINQYAKDVWGQYRADEFQINMSKVIALQVS